MRKKAIMLSSVLVLPQLLSIPLVGAESISRNYTTEAMVQEISKPVISPVEQNQVVNAKVSKDEAVQIAKGFITIPQDYSQQSINYQSNWYPGNRSVWNINWYKQSENSYGNISITIDAETGTVVQMNRWDDTVNDQTSYPPKYNWESASKVAENFLQQKVPHKVNVVKLDDTYQSIQKPPLHGSAYFNFSFLRVENGISFSDQYISVTLNGNGEVTGYDYRWNENIDIPTTDGMMSQPEAEKKIKGSLPVELKYQTIYQPNIAPNEQPTVKLTYDSRIYYPYIDAKTGKWLDYIGKNIDEKSLTAKLEPLSKEKPQPTTPAKKELTQDEAIQVAKKYFTIPADSRLESVNYTDRNEYRKFPTWDLNWVKGQHEAWIYVSINADTGEIINYNNGNSMIYRPLAENEKIKQVINYEQAKEKAIEMIKKISANKMHELTFDPAANQKPDQPEISREFNFNFHRLADGVLVQDQFVSIGISPETGEVFNYYQNWDHDIKLTDKNNAVPVNEAKDVYFDNFNIQPRYAYFENYDYYRLPAQQTSKPQVKLVYNLFMKPNDQGVYLDAVKGKWVSMETGEPIREKIAAKDIKGHPAEKALQLLIDYNAIEVDEAGLVKPFEEITRGEMIKTLMLVTNPDPYYYKMNFASADRGATFEDVQKSSPYFAYVESAVQQGLLDKSKGQLKPNEPISREELATLIVNALGLEKLAKVPSLFNSNFADASDINSKGAAAIVHHLKIMPAKDNKFEPANKVTRGDGAQVFYQFLQERGKYNR